MQATGVTLLVLSVACKNVSVEWQAHEVGQAFWLKQSFETCSKFKVKGFFSDAYSLEEKYEFSTYFREIKLILSCKKQFTNSSEPSPLYDCNKMTDFISWLRRLIYFLIFNTVFRALFDLMGQLLCKCWILHFSCLYLIHNDTNNRECKKYFKMISKRSIDMFEANLCDHRSRELISFTKPKIDYLTNWKTPF